METIAFPVLGMNCSGCVRSVTRVLSAIEGVSHVEVSLENKMASVQTNSSSVSADQLKLAVRDAGYETP